MLTLLSFWECLGERGLANFTQLWECLREEGFAAGAYQVSLFSSHKLGFQVHFAGENLEDEGVAMNDMDRSIPVESRSSTTTNTTSTLSTTSTTTAPTTLTAVTTETETAAVMRGKDLTWGHRVPRVLSILATINNKCYETCKMMKMIKIAKHSN